MNDSDEIRPSYRVKVTHYPRRQGELVVWYDEPIGREERRFNQLYPAPRQPREHTDEEKQENLHRAFRRAKSQFRKLVMTLGADRILTLTFRENLTDRSEADKIFVRFIKKVHAQYPNWKYVAVAEKQKRGAWHYHLAVSGFQDVGFLRSAWRSLTDGNIDVSSPRTRGNKAAASVNIAGYLSKYMTKAFIENHEHGKYRYRASNHIELKQTVFWLKATNWNDAQREAAVLMIQHFGQIGRYFFSDDWTSIWFASWASRSWPSKHSKASPTT